MTEVAGETADGFLTHPFATRKSLGEHTLPALERGLRRAGRSREDLEVVCVTLVVTGEGDEEIEDRREVVRKQLAFYASTPAYRPTLECHGWGDLQPELNALSKAGRWDDMATLISDDLLDAVAVVGRRHEIATRITRRLSGLAGSVSIENTRAPGPRHFADILPALKSA